MLEALLTILVIVLISSVRFARRDERIVVMRLGSVIGARGPGLVFVIPPIEKAIRVKLSGESVELDGRSFETADGREVRYSGEVQWKVLDPVKSVMQIQAIPQTVQEFAAECLTGATKCVPYSDVGFRKREFEEQLAEFLRKKCGPCGLELMKCTITGVEPVTP
ncbi:MAG TPA: SPFH domain-containing protein [Candidatus Limnocylindrales bacterium]|nr:SPFH domain-containing protein [Candidatus Limnocylindrales bacterium]